MGNDRLRYEAGRFAENHRMMPVDKRLAFDVWADRRGYDSGLKRRLWRAVKDLARQRAA